MAIRVRAIVSGRVQGVYYRASTQEEARRLGVIGWVRNLANGNVEFEAEGNQVAVDGLLTWAKQGPSLAAVAFVDVTKLPVTGKGTSFEIHHSS